jgi:hypothetical protein
MPCPSHSFSVARIIFGEEYRSESFSVCSLLMDILDDLYGIPRHLLSLVFRTSWNSVDNTTWNIMCANDKFPCNKVEAGPMDRILTKVANSKWNVRWSSFYAHVPIVTGGVTPSGHHHRWH